MCYIVGGGDENIFESFPFLETEMDILWTCGHYGQMDIMDILKCFLTDSCGCLASATYLTHILGWVPDQVLLWLYVSKGLTRSDSNRTLSEPTLSL